MAKKIAKKIEKKAVKTTKPVKKATKKPAIKKAAKPVKKAPTKKVKQVEEEPDFELGGTPDNGELSEDFLPADELESEMMGGDLELPDDEEED